MGFVVHELRNPLSAMHASLESYVRAGATSKDFNKSIAQDLLSEVKRLIALSESLLAFESREKTKRSIEDCNVKEVLESVLVSLRHSKDAKELKIVTELTNAPMHINSRDLYTIVYNLLHNAFKFSKINSTVSIFLGWTHFACW